MATISTLQPASLWPASAIEHGERIGLLAVCRGGAPDPDAARGAAPRHEPRQHDVAEIVERRLVAEEIGFLHRDSSGPRASASRSALGFVNASMRWANDGNANSLSKRPQLGLDEVHLVLAELDARALLQDAAQQIILVGHHGRCPRMSIARRACDPGRRQKRGAGAGRGRGARHPPHHARGSRPGQSRCRPHRRWPARRPRHPGPCRSARCRAPPGRNLRPRSRTSGSAAGRQKLTGGPSVIPKPRRPRAMHGHVVVARRHVDRAGLKRLPIHPFLRLAPGIPRQAFGKDRGEHRRHVLRDQHRSTRGAPARALGTGWSAPAGRRWSCRWR